MYYPWDVKAPKFNNRMLHYIGVGSKILFNIMSAFIIFYILWEHRNQQEER